MPAQMNYPVNKISTDVGEFEHYLRQASEFVAHARPCARGTRVASQKRNYKREILLKSREPRTGSGAISRRKAY